MNWYMEALKNFTDFNGRARRKEYWTFNLVNGLILILLYKMTILYFIFILVICIPSLAVGIRRLHDIEKSGWYLLLSYIPFANIWLIIMLCMDGTCGSNKYGDSPKQIGY